MDLPKTIEQIMELDELSAAVIAEKFMMRVLEIGKLRKAKKDQVVANRKNLDEIYLKLKSLGIKI